MKAKEIYDQMINAANRAQQNSNLYNLRNEELKAQNEPELVRDRDLLLAKYFNRYNFWRNEQIRLGELLKAHIAYIEIVGKGYDYVQNS